MTCDGNCWDDTEWARENSAESGGGEGVLLDVAWCVLVGRGTSIGSNTAPGGERTTHRKTLTSTNPIPLSSLQGEWERARLGETGCRVDIDGAGSKGEAR